MHRRRSFTRRDAIWAAACVFVFVLGGGAAYAVASGSPAYTHQCVITETPKPGGGFTRTEDCDPLTPSTSPSATPSPSSSPTATPTPSASPTSTPTPSPSPSTTAPGTTNCLAAPAKCGFPDAASTGPTGTLTATTWTDYWTAGQTVRDVQINGCVTVHAKGVTFVNVRVNAAGCFWGVRNLSTGLSLVDSEITCGGANGTGIGSTGYSLLRVDIHDCENGLDVGGSVSIVDSWIHNGVTANGAHTDGIQIGQGATGVTIRHNVIDMPTPGATSAIISWDENDPQQQQVVIDANLLSGGTYELYCPRQGTSDTRVTNNRFGRFEYGYSDSCTGTHVSAWSGNVRDSDGAALAAA